MEFLTKAKKMFFLNRFSAHSIKQSSSTGISGFSAKLACIVTLFVGQCVFGVERGMDVDNGYETENGYKSNYFLKNHESLKNYERRIYPSDEGRKYVQDRIEKRENWYISRLSNDGKNWGFIFVTNLTDQKEQKFKEIKQKIDSISNTVIFLVNPTCFYNDLKNNKIVSNKSPINGGNMHQNEYPKDSETADYIDTIISGIREPKNSENNKKSVSIAFLATIEYMQKIASISGVDLGALPLHKFLPEDGIRMSFNSNRNDDSLPAGVIQVKL